MNANETLLLKHGAAFEYVPDRLGIAVQLLASATSGCCPICVTDRDINDAVEIADKLIARINETQK